MLVIGFLADRTIVRGLPPAEMVLLVLMLGLSMRPFASPRTNVLLGAVHLLLFLAYMMLLLDQ